VFTPINNDLTYDKQNTPERIQTRQRIAMLEREIQQLQRGSKQMSASTQYLKIDTGADSEDNGSDDEDCWTTIETEPLDTDDYYNDVELSDSEGKIPFPTKKRKIITTCNRQLKINTALKLNFTHTLTQPQQQLLLLPQQQHR